MSDPRIPAPPTENWVTFPYVPAYGCIPLEAVVQVNYSNANVDPGTVGISCGGAVTPADQAAPVGTTGTLCFNLVHTAPGTGHALVAALKKAGVPQFRGSVSPVKIGNPCPIKINDPLPPVGGYPPSLDPKKEVAGTFEPNVGNRIDLMLEDPGNLDGPTLPPPALLWLDRAEVSVVNNKEGTWKYAAIPGAKKGYLLRVVLSKDGVVKSTIRAIFV